MRKSCVKMLQIQKPGAISKLEKVSALVVELMR